MVLKFVDQSQISPNLSPAYKESSSYMSGARLVGKHREIRTGPKSSLGLRRLPVRPERGQGQTHPRVLADLKCKNPDTSLRFHLPAWAVNVLERVTDCHREASTPGSPPHGADTVVLEE